MAGAGKDRGQHPPAPESVVISGSPEATAAPSAPSPLDSSAMETPASPTSAPPATSATTRLNLSDLESVIGGLGPAQALTAIDNQLVLLTPGMLYRLSQTEDGAITVDLMSSPGLPFGDPAYPSLWELIADGKTLYLVAPEVEGRLYRVSTPDLAGLTTLLGQPVDTTDLAALNGALYQNTASGIFAVTESGGGEEPVARGGAAMAADTTRDRLLVLNDDGAWVVHAYVPAEVEPATSSSSLPFAASDIAVADGRIWVTGTGHDGEGMLVRLDPESLEITRHSEITEALASAPVIVAAGRDLWTRSKDAGPELWCVDARTRAIAQHWDSLPGIVATSGHRAYIADGTLVGEIALNDACAG